MQDVRDYGHTEGGLGVKKGRLAALALGAALLLPLLAHARRVLPMDSRPLVEAKYAGWSGVLRLWVYEGWPSGSGGLAGWLNRCAAGFEKRHPGVYVQPQAVDAGAIAAFRDSGILPPDMLLIPPGLLDAPEGLAALDAPEELRAPLRHCGQWRGSTYAAPVAAGGYIWAYDAALADGVPGDWCEAGLSPAVPEDEPGRCWGAALLAMCAGRREAAEALPEVQLPGVDLGLAGEATPAPTKAPAGPLLPCRLPEGFQFDGDAWRDFADGDAPALLATQREVRRLEALSARGKGPDWRLAPGAAAFTDQLLCLAVVDKSDDERRALCAAFLDWLLSDECQGDLAAAGAFAVTDAASGYAPGDALATLDAALRDPALVAPNCFDKTWPEIAKENVREFISGAGESPALWRALAVRLAENPNIPAQSG